MKALFGVIFVWRKCQLWASALPHVLHASCELGLRQLRNLLLCRAFKPLGHVPSLKKRIGTSHIIHTLYNSEPILGSNESLSGSLHTALAYRYYFSTAETSEHVSLYWHLGKYQFLTNCFMCWMPTSNAGPRVTGNSANHSSANRSDHWAMTHPSESDCHQPHGVTHPSQWRVDSWQERFST